MLVFVVSAEAFIDALKNISVFADVRCFQLSFAGIQER